MESESWKTQFFLFSTKIMNGMVINFGRSNLKNCDTLSSISIFAQYLVPGPYLWVEATFLNIMHVLYVFPVRNWHPAVGVLLPLLMYS